MVQELARCDQRQGSDVDEPPSTEGMAGRWVTSREMQQALQVYGISKNLCAQQVGVGRRNLRRYFSQEEDSDLPGDQKHPPGWLVCVLLMYEWHPETRCFLAPPAVPGVVAPSESETIPSAQLAAALDRYGVTPQLFAKHTGRTLKAILSLLDGTRPQAPAWMRWFLLMYDWCPDMRDRVAPVELPTEWSDPAAR